MGVVVFGRAPCSVRRQYQLLPGRVVVNSSPPGKVPRLRVALRRGLDSVTSDAAAFTGL